VTSPVMPFPDPIGPLPESAQPENGADGFCDAEIATWCDSRAKRVFDAVAAAVLLVLALPLLAAVSVLVKLSSPGPVIFRQRRMGRNGMEFCLLKFRSMSDTAGPLIASARDPRITRIGRYLRRSKLDELPQLINVLKGDMSFVGPRPYLPEYFAAVDRRCWAILRLKPGVTGVATLKFRKEEDLLAKIPRQQLNEYYYRQLLPEKIRLELEYARAASMWSDWSIVSQTAFALLFPQPRKRHDPKKRPHLVVVPRTDPVDLQGAPKIVHLTSVHDALDIRIFRKECQSLAQEGYGVVLIAPHTRDEVVNGVQIRAINKRPTRLGRMSLTLWQLYRRAREENADVYHIHDPELIPLALLLRFHGKRIIFDAHEHVPNQLLQKDWIPAPLRYSVARIFHGVDRWAARHWTAVVTANEDISERYADACESVVAVHNYSELAEFSQIEFKPERYASGVIVHCGGISRRTALPSIVAGLQGLPAGHSVRLVATGTCHSQGLLARLQQMPGWKYVDWRGMVPREEMLSIVSAAGLALVLYGYKDNHLNIRSNRLFEAMAAGIPVIASDFPEWKETVEGIGCGICVQPDDPHAIASAISYLRANPQLAMEMGMRGRAVALEKYNWSTEREKLLHLYKNLSRCVVSPQYAPEVSL
jgi:lipopolysaccharide/colanic/teichoic acid biosynthesis glycosyltransferase/glycosyltransferase involved in cell wall biosynthesis